MACSSGDKHVDDPDGPDNPGGGDEYEDIQVVNGKVRFYLREAENSVRKAMGTGERAWSKSLVSVNGKSYAVESDENGRYYVEASASSSGTYNAILTNSGSSGWYGSSAYADVKLPYSQFWAATAAALQSYPMYGSYTKENGNKLVFDDAFAVLDLALYPDAGSEKLLLQDLYAALHAPGEILIFEHYESCYPGFLKTLPDLAVKGSAPLSSRYLVNKEGILVDAGTALAPGAVSSITPCGKYLIFFSR